MNSTSTSARSVFFILRLRSTLTQLIADFHYRHYRCVEDLSILLSLSFVLLGPKVNTVEKLAELRRAGVNVGACSVISDNIQALSD